ncbi:MAG: BON domain-containing protein [Bdellovibrionales bacterium]|nr:BON domain-containing protein [Oligoflexia bacterium]
MKQLLLALTLLGAASFTRAVGATNESSVAPDNSALNQRDRSHKIPTADSQMRGSKLDIELTRKIRRELTKDASFSTYAKNVKVITHEGEVILRGPVRSESEENKIVAIAKQIAGETSVQNHLEVKTNQ